MKNIEYKEFIAEIEIDLEDDIITGKVVNSEDLICFHANSPGDIKKVFRETIDDYLEACKEEKIKPSKVFDHDISSKAFEKIRDYEYILCAANYIDDGVAYKDTRVIPRNKDTGFVICGWRHHNCLGLMYEFMHGHLLDKFCIQGFLTSKGNFLTRESAKELAIKIGQVIEDKMISDTLTSEDLW